ncbi:LamG-like jellyroll fold domain-containing protein [Planctomycetota bacterium]
MKSVKISQRIDKETKSNATVPLKSHQLYRPNVITLFLLFLIITALTGISTAATYYINPINGNDSYSGSQTNPWRSLSKAKTTAVAGDTVNLLPGNYGSVIFGEPGDNYGTSWNQPIIFQNDPGSQPYSAKFSYIEFTGPRNFFIIVSGFDVENTGQNKACIATYDSSYVKIKNCKTHGQPQGVGPSYAIIFVKYSDNVIVEDCEVYYGGTWAFAIEMEDSDNITIRGCNVHDIIGSGIRTGGGQNYFIENNIIHDQREEWNSDVHGSGISIHSHNTTLRGNIIYNYGNTRPIRFYQSYAGYDGYRNMLVENNLVYKTPDFTGTQWWIEFIDVGPNCLIRNNTFIDSVVIVFARDADGSGLSIHNNVVTGDFRVDNYDASASGPGRTKWDSVSEGGNFFGGLNASGCGWLCNYTSFSSTSDSVVGGSFSVGSFFESGAQHYPYTNGYPYQLHQSSPAIDFANSYYAPATDLLGNSRVGQPDSGCFEYGSGTTPPPTNLPPTANAGSDQTTTDSDGNGSEMITLNAYGSSDQDGSIVSYQWRLNSLLIATGVNPTVSLPTGSNLITLTVTDNDGATDTDTVNINITAAPTDNTPPAILSVAAARNSVNILFNEPLDPAFAQNVDNYQIDNAVSIAQATLDTQNNSVTLTTSEHIEQVTYTLTCLNICDLAQNTMPQTFKTYTYNANANLAGYWKFDENAGTTTADSSDNNNTATLTNGPTWTQYGTISFDGIDDYLYCGNDSTLNLTDCLTISASINPAGFGQNGWGRIVDKGSGQNGFSFFIEEATKTLAYAAYGGLLINSNQNIVQLNNWQHVAMVYDSSANIVTFYLNGQPAGTTNYTTPPADSAAYPLVIGIRGYDFNRAFNGSIDNVRVYERALNSNEIVDLFDQDFPFAFYPIGDKQINENSNLNFTVDTANSGTTVTLADHNLPSQPIFTENAFNWTPTYEQAGTYEATFAAAVGQIEDIETITITVNNVNRQPVIEPISDKSVDENSTMTFSVSAYDPDGDSVSCSAQNLPQGASFTNDNFQWTPNTDQASTYNVTILATDGQAQTSQTVQITVNDLPTTNEPIIIDNGSVNTCSTGTWQNSGAANPYGLNSLWSRNGSTYTWTFKPTTSGLYNLDMWWTSWTSRSPSVPVQIQHVDGTTTVYVNQLQNGGKWNSLGQFSFDAGTSYNITITSQASPTSTCADAVRFTPTTNQLPTELIIDNRDSQTSCTGIWQTSGAINPYDVDSLWSRDGSTFTWTFSPTATAPHTLSMWWTTWPSRSNKIPVSIKHTTGTSTVYINQQQNGGKWNSLGTFTFEAGKTYTVTITSQAAPTSTCADAIKLTPADLISSNDINRPNHHLSGTRYKKTGVRKFFRQRLATGRRKFDRHRVAYYYVSTESS